MCKSGSSGPPSVQTSGTLQKALLGSHVRLVEHPEDDCAACAEPSSSAAQRPLYWCIQSIPPPRCSTVLQLWLQK